MAETTIKTDKKISQGLPEQFSEPLPVLASAPAALSSEADRRLLLFRRIAAPLMASVAGWSYTASETGASNSSENATQFAGLIDSTVSINKEILSRLGMNDASETARWLAASASAEIVAAHYRATTRPLSLTEAEPMLDTLEKAIRETLGIVDIPDRNDDAMVPLGKSLKALAPAVSSVARFSFGRDATELLEEVTRRLTTIAIEIAIRLRDPEETDFIAKSPLYHAVLEVAGEFYMESHFSEMDRLLAMPPEERREYVRAHDKKIPMEPVWEGLELRMAMLETMTTHLPTHTDSHEGGVS